VAAFAPAAASATGAHTEVLAPGSGYGLPHGAAPVRSLQRRLAAAGFAAGTIDGVYGLRTEDAVTRFQAATGLVADGVAGPSTLSALYAPVPTLRPGAGYGSGGSGLVRALQSLLTRAGFHPGGIDGLYGPRTERAVRRFEAAHGLRVDGVAGPQTFVALRAQPHAQRPPEAAMRRPVPAPAAAGGPQAPAAPAHPASRPSATWPALLAALLAAALLLFAAAAPTRRRRASRERSPEDRPAAPAPAADDAAGAFRLALLREKQNDAAGAEAAYRRADKAGHAGAASNLGVLLEQRRDTEGAEAAYRRADARGDPNGAFNLALLLEEHGDLAGAEAVYRRADERGHAAAASNLGVLLERCGDLDGAGAAYRRADARGDPNGAFNLALLLEEQRDITGAAAAYRRAGRRGPAAVANAARAALRGLRLEEARR
jgi:peptidoglycan hydrolase-like protein with peptidoglycan-binding domain